ncbi:MAG: chromophore lyase CpcT/CpeT [Acidobacteria bacterium]|nr:chromophore lyase CpcT/CpeT [Acidobacteriota bacterium]
MKRQGVHWITGWLILLVGFIPGQEPVTKAPVTGFPEGLRQLAAWMTGEFSSKAQAESDDSYFAIRLVMARVWPDRTDGLWLYVEQAVAETPDQPYRQRIYRLLHVGRDIYESQVYEVPQPVKLVRAWQKPELLAELSPERLETRDGCAILLRRRGDAFVGSTLADLCRSTHRGATYATSQVTITADGMVSWDRGFDEQGHQVWGAEKGGYVFRKIRDLPLE